MNLVLYLVYNWKLLLQAMAVDQAVLIAAFAHFAWLDIFVLDCNVCKNAYLLVIWLWFVSIICVATGTGAVTVTCTQWQLTELFCHPAAER